jgi:hypothetical protein
MTMIVGSLLLFQKWRKKFLERKKTFGLKPNGRCEVFKRTWAFSK